MKPKAMLTLYMFAGCCFAITAIYYITAKKYYLAGTNFALCLSIVCFGISYSKRIKK